MRTGRAEYFGGMDVNKLMMNMKTGPVTPKQRSRGRGPNGGKKHSGGGGGGGIPGRNHVFDSNGPDGRIRGNAHQVLEKYLALARDASSQGDRVAAENFYQHAEHYFRLINAQNQNNGRPRQALPTPAEDQMLAEDEGEDGYEGEGEPVAETAEAEAVSPGSDAA